VPKNKRDLLIKLFMRTRDVAACELINKSCRFFDTLDKCCLKFPNKTSFVEHPSSHYILQKVNYDIICKNKRATFNVYLGWLLETLKIHQLNRRQSKRLPSCSSIEGITIGGCEHWMERKVRGGIGMANGVWQTKERYDEYGLQVFNRISNNESF
jgi:hypothetical protein